jgi:hypothetical protein
MPAGCSAVQPQQFTSNVLAASIPNLLGSATIFGSSIPQIHDHLAQSFRRTLPVNANFTSMVAPLDGTSQLNYDYPPGEA